MFDTNIFNHIIEGKIILEQTENVHQYFITHIQQDELNATKNIEKKQELLNIFKIVEQILIPTESALWEISDWDSSKWNEKIGLYNKVLMQLEKEKPHHRGNKKDALIGETAIKTSTILITDDNALRKTVTKLGGRAMSLNDFLQEIKHE